MRNSSTYSPTRVRRIVLRGIIDAGRDEIQQDDISVRRRHDEVDEAVGRGCEVAAFDYDAEPVVFTAHSHAELNLLVWRRSIVVPRDT